MKIVTRIATGAVALTAGLAYLIVKRHGLHADRTPPAWVTRFLTFA